MNIKVQKNKGLVELKENNINYYTDIYEAWQTKQKLKPWREVERQAWWSKFMIFTRLASVWTWIQEFKGFWFKPKSYSIFCSRNGISQNNKECYSNGGFDWTNQAYMQMADSYNRVNTWSVLRLLYTNQWWGQTIANHSSFLNDWIALNFTSSQEDCTLFITAHW